MPSSSASRRASRSPCAVTAAAARSRMPARVAGASRAIRLAERRA
nr:hypothetical protein [Nonomuraea gerenzanensis]